MIYSFYKHMLECFGHASGALKPLCLGLGLVGLAGCGGGGGGGGGGSSGGTDIAAIVGQYVDSSTASGKLSDLNSGATTTKALIFSASGTPSGLDVSFDTSKATVDGTNLSKAASSSGTLYGSESSDYIKLSDFTASTGNGASREYSTFMSADVDGKSFNDAVVGTKTETAAIEALQANTTPVTASYKGGTIVGAAYSGDQSKDVSSFDLEGNAFIQVDFSTGKVGVELSALDGTCTGTCGTGSVQQDLAVTSVMSISIEDATIRNSGFYGGTFAVSDTNGSDGLDFSTADSKLTNKSNGGHFFGSSTVGGLTIPKEAGGNFYMGSSSQFIRGGYIGVYDSN